MELKQIEFDFPEISLISYNDVNPSSIKLDTLRIIRRGVYTFGDLHNALPPGLKLSPKHSNRLNAAIARLVDLRSKKYSDVVNFIKNSDQIAQTGKELTEQDQ